VKAFVGVHPSEALVTESLAWLGPAAERAAGIGEIGLDPRYSPLTKESKQRIFFEKQIRIAEQARLPVQVHSRGAPEECIATLGESGLDRVLLHWFEGEEMLSKVMDLGYYVSFGPTLMHSKKLQRMAASADPDFVLTESDGPVRFGALGDASGPQLIPSVAFKLAEVWGEPFEDALRRLVRNCAGYLGEREKG
jgi:TatD DNase family protein